MAISEAEERRFYDDHYSRFLQLPDADLVFNRAILLRDIENPSHPAYERRKLYRMLLEAILGRPLAGCRTLEYGCGTGDWALVMAAEGAEATLLDLSPVAIEVGLRRARASGVASRVRGVSRDASELSCFETGEFDLIVACAALHHTLKYPNALAELARILKPGGRILVAETYGNNPLLNAARRMQWRLSSLPQEAGEEIIVSRAEIALLRQRFPLVKVTPVNLLAMAKRFFRGRFEKRGVRGLIGGLELIDEMLLWICRPLRNYCGEVLIEIEG